MTDTTISNLPAGAPAEPTDQIPIARGGANYSLTAQDIANLGGGGGSPGGVNTNVQFNNNGAFGGTNDFTTDGAGTITLTTAVTVGDSVNAGSSYVSVTANPLNGYALIDCIEPAGNIGINVASPTNNNQVTGMRIFSGNINGSIALKFFDEPILWQNGNSGHNVLSFNVLGSDSVQTLNNTLDDGAGNMTATSVVVNSATGGSQGAGTVNSTGYYVNGASIYSYGQFLSENTQTVVSVGDAQSITFTGSSGTADITLVDSSKITFANPGVYLVASSVVTNDTVGGNALVYWVNQNSTPITDSATVCGQPIGGLLLTSACTYIVTTTIADEFIEMVMTGQATTNEITATPAGTVGAASPLSPSIIVTVNKVG